MDQNEQWLIKSLLKDHRQWVFEWLADVQFWMGYVVGNNLTKSRAVERYHDILDNLHFSWSYGYGKAIHVRIGQQIGSVLRRDAPTVDDAHAFRRHVAPAPAQPSADESASSCHVLRRDRRRNTDGAFGLVDEGHRLHLLRLAVCQHAIQLPL